MDDLACPLPLHLSRLIDDDEDVMLMMLPRHDRYGISPIIARAIGRLLSRIDASCSTKELNLVSLVEGRQLW